MIYIYSLACPLTGDVRYIGKSKWPKARLAVHITRAKCVQTDHHCARWIRGLLNSGLKPVMEIIQTLSPDDDWQQAERDAIRRFRDQGCDLTNLTGGGDGFHDVAPEILLKRGASLKRTLATPEAKAGLVARAKEISSRPEIREARSAQTSAAWRDPVKAAAILAGMNDPDVIRRQSEATSLRHADPEFNAAHIAKMREVTNTPEMKEVASQRSLKVWADPEVTSRRVSAIKAAHARPETKEKLRLAMAAVNATPETKAARGAALKARWADPVERAKLAYVDKQAASDKAKAQWADPDHYAAMLAQRQTPEYRARAAELARRRATPEYKAMMAEKTRLSWEKRRANAHRFIEGLTA